MGLLNNLSQNENKVELGLFCVIILIIIFALMLSSYSGKNSEVPPQILFEPNCIAFCNTYSGMGYDHVNELGECLCWKDSLTIYGNHSYITNRTQNYGIINAFYQKS